MMIKGREGNGIGLANSKALEPTKDSLSAYQRGGNNIVVSLRQMPRT